MKKYQTKSRKLSSSPLLKRVAVGLLGVGIVLGVLVLLDVRNVIDLPFFKDKPTIATTDGINYGPPTEQEKAETEQFKDGQGETPSTTPPPVAGQKNKVTPVLTSWGAQGQSIEAGGFVSVVEGGGTCTLTATKGGQSVSQSAPATANAQNVSCGLITITSSSLTAGTWSITLTYNSASSDGSSQPQTVEIP